MKRGDPPVTLHAHQVVLTHGTSSASSVPDEESGRYHAHEFDVKNPKLTAVTYGHWHEIDV